jgi:hypothetical protein
VEGLQDKEASEKAGSPVFRDVLYVEIRVPNQQDFQPRPAQDADKQRFPISWRAFQEGTEAPIEGLPLQEWPQLTGAEAKPLMACGIKTVQQLAEVADSGIHRLGAGGMSLKVRAQKYLKSLDRMDDLEKRNQELEARLQDLESRPEKTAKKASKKNPRRLKVAG